MSDKVLDTTYVALALAGPIQPQRLNLTPDLQSATLITWMPMCILHTYNCNLDAL